YLPGNLPGCGISYLGAFNTVLSTFGIGVIDPVVNGVHRYPLLTKKVPYFHHARMLCHILAAICIGFAFTGLHYAYAALHSRPGAWTRNPGSRTTTISIPTRT